MEPHLNGDSTSDLQPASQPIQSCQSGLLREKRRKGGREGKKGKRKKNGK